jgi:integrase/recombinase XerD
MPRRPMPDPLIVPLQPSAQPDRLVIARPPDSQNDSRQHLVEQFLQTRSLSTRSQTAYQQDLNRFMRWSDSAWETVTQRQIALFKADLLEQQLALTTVNRTLKTLKTFYDWMVSSHSIRANPAIAVTLLKLEEPDIQALSATEVASIYQAAATSKSPNRDLALVSVLLHGLRVEEISALNLEDYDGTQLCIRQTARSDSHSIPLASEAIAHLDRLVDWRVQGERLNPDSPIFLSYSRRSYGQRLTYWGIRDVIDAIKAATQIDLNPQRFRQTFAIDGMTRIDKEN